jgi:hypothetical protein
MQRVRVWRIGECSLAMNGGNPDYRGTVIEVVFAICAVEFLSGGQPEC